MRFRITSGNIDDPARYDAPIGQYAPWELDRILSEPPTLDVYAEPAEGTTDAEIRAFIEASARDWPIALLAETVPGALERALDQAIATYRRELAESKQGRLL